MKPSRVQAVLSLFRKYVASYRLQKHQNGRSETRPIVFFKAFYRIEMPKLTHSWNIILVYKHFCRINSIHIQAQSFFWHQGAKKAIGIFLPSKRIACIVIRTPSCTLDTCSKDKNINKNMLVSILSVIVFWYELIISNGLTFVEKMFWR